MTKEEIKKEMEETRELCRHVLQDFCFPADFIDLYDQKFKWTMYALKNALKHAEKAHQNFKEYLNQIQ